LLPGLHVLPIEDSLLEQIVEGVTQFDIEVTRGWENEDVGVLGENAEQCKMD
jgi:hypothetical protein